LETCHRHLGTAEAAAGPLGLTMARIALERMPYDYDESFRAAAEAGAGAVLVPMSPMIFDDRERLADAARRSRLPWIFAAGELAEAGGLMAFGANLVEDLPRAAGAS
jgi:putative ABC transport system substrate-binding protein